MKKISFVAALLWITPSVTAGDTVGTSSAVFLKKTIGARAAALGEAYTAVHSDPDAFFFNPASIAFQKKAEISAMYQSGISDISFGSLIYVHPIASMGTVEIGTLYSDAGSIDVNVTGKPREYKKAQQDIAYSIGYAREIVKGFSLGLGVKHIQSTLVEDYTSETNAVDAGLLIETPIRGLTVGASVLNIGKGLKYIAEKDPLPKTYRAGASYRYDHLATDNIMYTAFLTADGSWTLDEEGKGGIGLELTRDVFALRIGYLLNRDIEDLTAGIGIRWNRYSLDYAFGLVEDLDHNHRVSFHAYFGSLVSDLDQKQRYYQSKPRTLGGTKKK